MILDKISQLLTFLKDDPHDAFLLFALAREYSKAGRMQEALETYYSLREVHGDYVGLYYHLGQLEEMMGHPDRAYKTYKAGIEVARAASDAHAQAELEGVLALLEGR